MPISIHNASLIYNKTLLFDNISFALEPKQVTCLLGPSGAGKSTLLRMLAGLISPNNKTSSFHINSDNTQQIAYLPQQDTLLPWLNALDNTIIGPTLRGENLRKPRSTAKSLFEKMGLANAEKKYPHELSGGMRQRVALIRTLIEDKPIILMDEPFAALDAITRFQLQHLAYELLKDRTVFLVTHDPLEALRLADKIYLLYGQPAQLTLFAELKTPAARELNNPEIIKYQPLLFDALTKAKDNTL